MNLCLLTPNRAATSGSATPDLTLRTGRYRCSTTGASASPCHTTPANDE
jgi:hypothetical protein